MSRSVTESTVTKKTYWSGLRGCAATVEGKGDGIMILVAPPAHTDSLLATTTQCCLFWCDFQP